MAVPTNKTYPPQPPRSFRLVEKCCVKLFFWIGGLISLILLGAMTTWLIKLINNDVLLVTTTYTRSTSEASVTIPEPEPVETTAAPVSNNTGGEVQSNISTVEEFNQIHQPQQGEQKGNGEGNHTSSTAGLNL